MAKTKQKFNILLIASHHGFFLTLKTVAALKKNINNLVVIIPEEKIEKYSQMEGDMFQNFQSLVSKETKAVKSTAKVFTAKFNMFHRVSQTAEFLREISATGVWIQVCAGSVLQRLPTAAVLEDMSSHFLLMAKTRCYEGTKQLDMYNMLGQPTLELHEKQNTDSFIINADNIPELLLPDRFMIREAMKNGTFKSTNPHSISNEEELVDYAFAGKQLIDHAAKAAECVIADFWGIVMSANPPIDKLYAYPLELYLPFIDGCEGLMPDVTIKRIKRNATECKEYSLAFRDALR
jgi:hypothetical protein